MCIAFAPFVPCQPPPEGEKEVESIPGADVPIEVTKASR